MKIILFKLLLQLKKIIVIVLEKLGDRNYHINEEKSYQVENEIDSDCIINSIYEVLNEKAYEDNYNNILSNSDINEEYDQLKNDNYIEGIINEIIDTDTDTDTDVDRDRESNCVNEGKYNEDYNRVDIKAICKDRTITAIDKIYLIQLIANVNVAGNCVKMSVDELVNLFNNKNRNQVTKKMHDLERARLIKIIHASKGNRYCILKYIKDGIANREERDAIIRNDTSIISDNLECKDIQNKGVNDEIKNIIIMNINHFKEGVDLNEKCFNEIILKNSNVY